MPLDFPRARRFLQNAELAKLFIEELGWEPCHRQLILRAGDRDFTLTAVAEKRGFTAWRCDVPDGQLPDHTTRLKLDRQLTETSFEHLLVFVTVGQSRQSWLWVRREPGRPARARTHEYLRAQPGDSLLQKLQSLYVSLEEEEAGISITQIAGRARAAFDVERVTKRFYEEFRKQHTIFLKFISGIPIQGDREWYASVMLNRLMFLYFVQRKGFLDGDPDYLRNRLSRLRKEHGKDKFYSFYRYFLLRLFHEGLGAKERKSDLEKLIGRVPYLNGGIFDVHKLESPTKDGGYGEAIQIPDQAFEAIFDYFDRYQWHLDERPLRADNEINPDVLGYIFEKYINQKQMGAYYTKEDITEYIAKNTVLPFLFDKVLDKERGQLARECVFPLLQEDPDRYIYKAVRHGISWNYDPAHPDQGTPLEKGQPLPKEIAKGLNPPGLKDPVPAGAKPDDIPTLVLRRPWNKEAPRTHGLPTEIWRETIARRQRYWELWSRLTGCSPDPDWVANPPSREKLRERLHASRFTSHVTSINDFITLNLDIRRFAQDVIEQCESPELLAAFWHALAGRPARKSNEKPRPALTILDPTCGSGAFLFAALNILEPLYEACLDRMDALLAEARANARARHWKPHPDSHLAEFQRVLDEVGRHPNERYFIYKTIILHNLYGVDLMEEAVEICKLRLFLKLAAQVEPDTQDKNLGIEPLPDIDFNIRSGNTLVGYATRAELEKVAEGDWLLKEQVGQVLEAAEDAAAAYDTFVRSQLDGENPAAFKKKLSEKFGHAREQCDRFLAESYRMGITKMPKDFADWKRSHQPFHWFVEFFGILNHGGFDVIIGNPPYVEYSKVRSDYSLKAQYRTIACGNIYTCIVERSLALATKGGRVGMIVPLSLVCTSRTEELREAIAPHLCWISSYDMRPSSLFEGVAQRLSILVAENCATTNSLLFSGGYRRWSSGERSTLIPLTRYTQLGGRSAKSAIPKFDSESETHVLRKVAAPSLEHFARDSGPVMYIHRIVRYFVKALDFLPVFRDARGRPGKSEDYKEFHFAPTEQPQIAALLSSTLFYWSWRSHCDGFHCGYNDVFAMPFSPVKDSGQRKELAHLLAKLMKGLRDTSALKKIRTKAGNITYQEFYPAATKPILDEIDCVLAGHYGFTAEELDFIVNYDIKYRLGRTPDRRKKNANHPSQA